jgi:hypothetical protein
MSPRNSVHNNRTQFGYHPWEEEPEEEDTTEEDLREELVDIVREGICSYAEVGEVNCYAIVDRILERLDA